MKLNELKDNPGARKRGVIVGRGIGSGKGKTCGSGQKGQKSRTGVAIKGFEGGQSPLLRRMPKRGFNVPNAPKYAELTLQTLQLAIDNKKIDASAKLDAEALKAAGVISRVRDGVRLLGTGEIKSKVTLVVTGATKGAIAAVEKAGGKVEILPKKVNTLATAARKKEKLGKNEARRRAEGGKKK
ncbi:MAG: 50S ribosomal protein L15 [Alphaproteobacteria bacterium]|nr:50S ribosomal protein L15 [Alphaproteobacteria bacterium]